LQRGSKVDGRCGKVGRKGKFKGGNHAWAQQAQPVRVRGEITKVDGNTLSIKSRDGQNLTVKLADDARIAAMVKASLADIKEGAFIGVTGMPTVAGKDGQNLLVKYKDGEKNVVVPPNTPIARYTPGSASDLKIGAKVFVAAAQKQT
jgi:hypothetical protein